MIAVLAMAVFPTIALAGSNSSGAVYDPVIPKGFEDKGADEAGDDGASKTAKQETEPAPEPEAGPEERQQPDTTPPSEGGNQPPAGGGAGDGKAPRGSGGPDHVSVESIAPNQKVPMPSKPTHLETNGGGGSSPLLPILIGSGVLAAASIGVVVYRERGARPAER